MDPAEIEGTEGDAVRTDRAQAYAQGLDRYRKSVASLPFQTSASALRVEHAYIGYVPLHSSPMGRRLGYAPEDLPVTEEWRGT